jgi:hypothetical protein
VEGDPRTDTRAAAAHVVGVLWASGSQGVTVKELRGAIGLSRERLESVYDFLLVNPPLGLTVQRHGEEFFSRDCSRGRQIDRAAFEKTATGGVVQGGTGSAGHHFLSATHCASRRRAHPWLGQR